MSQWKVIYNSDHTASTIVAKSVYSSLQQPSQSAISIVDDFGFELPEDFVAEFNFAAFNNSEDGKETGVFNCGDKETLSATTLFIPKQRGYDT